MYDDDEPRPPENKPLINLYELLVSLISSLTPSITEKTLRDGSGERLNRYIDELIGLTQDNKLTDFKVQIRSINGNPAVSGDAYVRSLIGVANYLHKTNEIIGYYCAYPPEPKLGNGPKSPPTFTNQFNAEQQNQQTTTVQVEFNQTIISLTESLTNLERDHPDESSKENKFAKKLKRSLPTVKDTLSIIALVLKIAGEVGLSPDDALKLLKLS